MIVPVTLFEAAFEGSMIPERKSGKIRWYSGHAGSSTSSRRGISRGVGDGQSRGVVDVQEPPVEVTHRPHLGTLQYWRLLHYIDKASYTFHCPPK